MATNGITRILGRSQQGKPMDTNSEGIYGNCLRKPTHNMYVYVYINNLY